MADVFSTGSSPTDFQLPPHPACFGDSWNTSSICQVPSDAMIAFLNITTAPSYLDVYCNNPPADSCAFGYCPNSDVASPAVRYSTYFTSIVSAILVLYSPEEVNSSFFAQLLNVYSLIVAAIIAIGGHNLTRLHSVVAMTLASSPLSLYLVFYVLREMLGKQTRLKTVFGQGQYVNKALVLFMVLLWIGVLVFTSLPNVTWKFQQDACDSVIAGNHITSLFFLPFIVFFDVYPAIGAVILGTLLLMWAVAIFRLRKIIWSKKNKKFPMGRLWRKVVTNYPFVQFYTVILLPSCFWMFNVEVGIRDLSPREAFQPTYGQLLAIFVTVPPFISLCMLAPDLARWFADLTWVRVLTGRNLKPYLSKSKQPKEGSVLPLQEDTAKIALLAEKNEGLPVTETVELPSLPYK